MSKLEFLLKVMEMAERCYVKTLEHPSLFYTLLGGFSVGLHLKQPWYMQLFKKNKEEGNS